MVADFRRARVVMGGDVSLGRHVGFVPQVVYGRLWGEAVRQRRKNVVPETKSTES